MCTSKFIVDMFLYWLNLEKFPISFIRSKIVIIYNMYKSWSNLHLSYYTQHNFIHLSKQNELE